MLTHNFKINNTSIVYILSSNRSEESLFWMNSLISKSEFSQLFSFLYIIIILFNLSILVILYSQLGGSKCSFNYVAMQAGSLKTYFGDVSLRGWIACFLSSSFMGALLVDSSFLVFVQFICYNVSNYLYILKDF